MASIEDRSFLKKLDYTYSPGSFTFYIGVKDINLADYGFGNWNVWHYPHTDINAMYEAQLHGNMEQPYLAITAPTLHGHAKQRIAPPGGQQMVICTWAGYDKYKQMRRRSKKEYYREKERITDKVLDIVESYVPCFREHIETMDTGSPTTNERFCYSPQGNSYGMDLTPANLRIGKLSYKTPFQNMFLVNATTGMPGLGGAFRGSLNLYSILEQDAKIKETLYRRREIKNLLLL